MNPAFWFLVILGLALLWFLCNPVFKTIGGWFNDARNNVKKNTSDDEPDEDERTEDNFEQR